MFSYGRQGWRVCMLCVLLGSLTVPPVWSAGNVACEKALINQQGVDRADIVVSTTAVVVALANRNRCELVILNTSLDQDIRCLSSLQGDPTATKGFLLYAGLGIILTFEGRHQWKCIRDSTATADSAVSVSEVVP